MKKITLALITIVVIMIILMIKNEQIILTLETKSYVITNDYITDTLFKELNYESLYTYSSGVEELSNLYKNTENYYFKEGNIIRINKKYPIYTIDNSLINIDSESKIVDEDYKITDNYFGTILKSGELYNSDKTRVDNNTYLFLKTSTNLLINSMPIKVQTLNNEYVIPVNSIINFVDKDIRYYSQNDNTFKYNQITDVDNNTILTINNKETNYNNLLLKLGKRRIMDQIQIPIKEISTPPEEVIDNTTNNEEISQPIKKIYVDPKVSIEDFETHVYTITSTLMINDPSKAITDPVTVYVKKEDKTILKKSFYTSGEIELSGLKMNEEYDIEAEYTYTNENGEKYTRKIKNQKIKMGNINDLPPIKLSYEPGQIYSKKIELKDLKITSDIDAQIKQGVKKIIIQIGNDEYKLSQSQITNLLSGNSIDYTSPEKIKTNNEIEYQIKIYDMYGNEFKTENSNGQTRTCKEEPSVKIKPEGIDILSSTFKVTLENPDNVNIENYRYLVYNQDFQIVSEGNINDNKISIKNLDPSSTYNLKVLGDYDINDGNGSKSDNEIGSTKFVVPSLSTLGYVRAEINPIEINSENINLSIALDLERTDYRLIFLMTELEINLTKDNENKYTYKIAQEELETLKNGESIELKIENLTSNTEYNIECTSTIELGTKKTNINTIYNTKTITTKKQDPKILIKNKFSTETMIDFDLKIEDIDNAILDEQIYLQVRDSENKLISSETIKTNGEYIRLTYNKLESYKEYTFIFTAQEYNIGNTNATYIDNYELKRITYETKLGINGSVSLNQMITIPSGKNLFDFEKHTKKIAGTTKYNIVAKNEKISFQIQEKSANSFVLAQDIDVEPNTTYILSFDCDINNNKQYGTVLPTIYDLTNNQEKLTVKNLSTGTKKIYKFTTKNNTEQIKISKYIGGISNASILSYGDIVTYSNIQLEKSENATSYSPFQSNGKYQATLTVNLYDKNEEINNNMYYLDVYKNGIKQDRHIYSMNNLHNIEEDIHNIDVEKDSEYEIKLLIQVQERTYEIAYVSFTTEQEIRSISTTTEYYNMSPTGKYIVTKDLDFTGINKTYSTTFTGEIDFQGHTVKRNMNGASSYIMTTLGATGKVKNLVLDLSIDNNVERQNWYGFFYENYGTISNVMVTLNNSTSYGNVGISLLIWRNRGIIDTFVINTKEPLHGLRSLGLVSIHNYGTIRNGYVYGLGIDATFNNESTSNKYVGAISSYTDSNSIIENVYSLADIKTYNDGDYNKQVGSLIGGSYRSLVKNSYSVLDGNLNNTTSDISVGIVTGNYISENVYYVSDTIYSGKYSNKLSPLALNDPEIQEKILNYYGKFKIQENINKGYYPHVIFPECMPRQELIEIKKPEDSDLVDIISSEVLETQDAEATIKITINNPSLEKVKELNIKYVTAEVLSQTDNDGKSDVIVKITNPQKYLSTYSVMSISTQSAYNKIYNKEYSENERSVQINLYRNIKNLNDWRLMNTYTDENFKLMEDLDFDGATNIIIKKAFSGTLEGNGKTIKNITVEESDGLFAQLKGTIQNLFVENYKKTSATSYGGLIGQATGSPKINNVHMTNVEINGKYSGGIVGYTTYLTMNDSSVTNLKTKISTDFYDVVVGGLIGYVNNVAYIQNCFSQDIDIEVENTLKTSYVGGIVGKLSGGVVENTYSIGKIKSDATLGVGGIAGNSDGIIRRTYTMVNIENKFEYVGGIAGRIGSNPNNTLVIGNLYSNSTDNYIRRTSGNQISSPTLNNFAYNNLLINGYINDIYHGETELSLEQLNMSSTYSVLIGLGESFDYTEIDEKHVLPKLFGSNGKLLPNQKDNRITSEQNKVEILQIEQGITEGTIYLTIDNPEEYIVDSIEFDYLKVKRTNLNQTRDGKTYINVTVEPIRYYDTYKLQKINFNKNGNIESQDKNSRIELKYYKNLETFEDWQKIEDTNENYRLVADIDFENKVNINKNISFGRLEGTDGGHTLKNINLTFTGNNKSLIRNISINLENVNFENITLTNNSSGNYFGIILYNSGLINNVNFKDINISSRKINYVGTISYNLGKSLKNITFENIEIQGGNYTGAFIGSTVAQTITETENVTFENIRVTGTSQVGGAIGHQGANTAACRNKNYTAHNITVTGTGNYVGGLFGLYASVDTATVEEVHVTGVTDVGGIAGYSYAPMKYVTARDIHVTGSGNTIGGLSGYSLTLQNSYLYDSEVNGTTSNSNNVGGLVGNSSYNYGLSQSGTTNVIVKSLGSNVGGLRGNQSSSISYCFVYNGYVEGQSNVGGATGKFIQGTIQNTSINANVVATGSQAGGLVGYLNNQYTTNANNVSKIYNNMILNTVVEGSTDVGGLIGKSDIELYPGHHYNNLLSVDILSQGTASLSVGSNENNIIRISNLKAYRKSTINSENIENIISDAITDQNLISLDELKTTQAYTKMGLTTTYFDLTQPANGYFPLIKTSANAIVPNQTPIELPIEIKPKMMRMMMKSKSMRMVHEIPDIYIYQSEVDKINVEFSDIDYMTTINIYENGNLIDTKELSQRVYTYNYDYQSEITVELTDGLSVKTKRVTKDDLFQEATVINNNYYYIKDNRLIGNKYNGISNIVNLHNNKALTSEGIIYNLEDLSIIGKTTQKINQTETIPLYTFEYNGRQIKTYKNFSEIDGEQTENQLLVKNGKLYTIDKSLPIIKDSVIIDNYGGNNFESILCKDGYIYDLNSKIKVPKNFKNSRIKYMTNNLYDNSSYIIVIYENGTVYGFDYRTGIEILNDKTYTNISLADYFYNSFTKPENILPDNLSSQYNKAVDLEEILILNPIDKIINKNDINIIDDIKTYDSNKYIIMYDFVKGDYIIFDTENILNGNSEENNITYNASKNVESETHKIEKTPKIYKTYKTVANKRKKLSIDQIIIYTFLLILIIFSLILFLKNYKKLQKNYNYSK